MIRWYDYIASLVVANFMFVFFFTVPVIGAILAYMIYEFGWGAYCNFRLKQENE